MSDMTPNQALRYLERRMAEVPTSGEQAVTDGLAFEALWKLALLGRQSAE
jgi:hypothetical protein